MTETPPQKPHWEYPGTFNAAWRGTLLAREICLTRGDNEHAEILLKVLNALQDAHVVTLDRVQYEAIPEGGDSMLDFEPDPHLPFSILYISIGDPFLAGIILGATTSSETQRVAAIPFWGYDQDHNHVAPETVSSINSALPIGMVDATRHLYQNYLGILGGEENPEPKESQDQALFLTAQRAMDVIRFLESANVDFEDTPVSRQVRRNAHRKGTPISQRVYVRSGRRHRSNGDGAHEHIDFSHRFEVRGHYKHFGPDTRMFNATKRDNPKKIINHPTEGELVRIWCPPFVKGPEDKPLVIKTRVHKGHDQDS